MLRPSVLLSGTWLGRRCSLQVLRGPQWFPHRWRNSEYSGLLYGSLLKIIKRLREALVGRPQERGRWLWRWWHCTGFGPGGAGIAARKHLVLFRSVAGVGLPVLGCLASVLVNALCCFQPLVARQDVVESTKRTAALCSVSESVGWEPWQSCHGGSVCSEDLLMRH